MCRTAVSGIILDMNEERVDRAYTQALARAFWRGLRHRVTGGCNDLVPTSDVLAQLPHIKTNRLGTQSVALADIVGSTGRHRAFDLAFWPRRRQENGRWQRVAQARSSGKTLPPVQLYKIGRAYFVI